MKKSSKFLKSRLLHLSEEFNVTIRYEYDLISEIHLVEFPAYFANRITTVTKELFLEFIDKFPYHDIVFFPQGNIIMSVSEKALEIVPLSRETIETKNIK